MFKKLENRMGNFVHVEKKTGIKDKENLRTKKYTITLGHLGGSIG